MGLHKSTRDLEGICGLVRKHLRNFPLFNEDDKVSLVEIDDEKLWIGYKTTKSQIVRGTTHFDLNIIGKTCYVLWIELLKSERGKNHGKKLYKAIENFAKEFGCENVRLTPSGWTPQGKTRLEYMKSLGYHNVGIEVEKIL